MNNLSSTVLKAGVIVGTLDILSAFIYYFIATGDTNVFTVLKYIASGLFGKEAYAGGITMILTGLFLHYVIAFSFTIFFFWLHPKIDLLAKYKLLTGIMYGIFIWIIMNLLVVPLSRIPNRPLTLVNALINVAILIVCIGIPLSFMAYAHYRRGNLSPKRSQ